MASDGVCRVQYRDTDTEAMRHDPLYVLAYVVVFLVLIYVVLALTGAVAR